MQFPDEENTTDKFIVGLISAAVVLPFTTVIFEVFEHSTEPDFTKLQLNWPFLLKVLFATLRQRWNWAESKPGKVYVMSARFIYDGFRKIFVELFMTHAVEPAQEWIEERLGCGSGSESSESSDSSGSESDNCSRSSKAGSKAASSAEIRGGDRGRRFEEEDCAAEHDARHIGQISEQAGGGMRSRTARQHNITPSSNEQLEHGRVKLEQHGRVKGLEARVRRRFAKAEKEAAKEAEKGEQAKAFLVKVAVALVYTTWAVIVWVIFVYGAWWPIPCPSASAQVRSL